MLDQVIPGGLFALLLVLCRIGAAAMLLPGIGDVALGPRFRLMLAAGLSLVVVPVAGPLPGIPDSVPAMLLLVAGELAVGALLGLTVRLIASALHVAGTVIAMQTGLASAMVFDVTAGQAGALTAGFLSMVGVLFLFATDLHHPMLAALSHSYRVFPPGVLPPVDDAVLLVARTAGDAFNLGIRVAAPFLVFGVVFNLALGILNRLMPQLPVFFVALPLQISLGLLLLAASLGSGLMVYGEAMRDLLRGLTGG